MNPAPSASVPAKVLIVDDSEESRWILSHLIQKAGFAPALAASGEEALAHIRQDKPDVVLLDVCLPDMDGFQVLTQAKATERGLPIIMITAFGKTQDAVRAVRTGAYDYLAKPFNNEDVILTVNRVLEERALKRQVRRVHDQAGQATSLFECMGESAAIHRIVADVERVAATNLSVLLIGETGTGKELVARAIHTGSSRAAKAFVAVDCGAIPESLIESELFGHEKGAFTGAHQAVPGAFELADGGTLFLDEIGNLPLAMQGKLLRVLEEKRIRRIGGTTQLAVDFRVAAATNVDLQELLNQQAFRRDLYHRLAEFRIQLPPLREREEDIPLLVKRFLDLSNQELGKNVRDLSAPALDMILAYDWPGNVRELRNQVRRAMLFVDGAEEVITPDCLEMIDRRHGPVGDRRAEKVATLGGLAESGSVDCWCRECPLRAPEALLAREGAMPLKDFIGRVVAHVERSILMHVLKQTNGNKAEAARLLRIDYKTIHAKLKGYNISASRYRGDEPSVVGHADEAKG